MQDPSLNDDLERSLAQIYGTRPKYKLTRLQGEASSRVYYRLTAEQPPHSAIVMRLPADAMRSDEGGQSPQPTTLPFLEVGSVLRDRGVRVPNLLAQDVDRRVIVLEDLGDETFESRLQRIGNPTASYKDAVQVLANMHNRCADLPPDCIVSKRHFDVELLTWEFDHFVQWGLVALFGELSQQDQHTIEAQRKLLVDTISSLPTGFVHRDFQSRNLMWVDGQLVIIDFQDALIGPRVYDLVALLNDSYVDLDEALQREAIATYAAATGSDPAAIAREFWLVAVHRKLKDAGRFVYIDRVRNNPAFLKHYPLSLRYVGSALSHIPELSTLAALLTRLIPGFADAVEVPRATRLE